MSNKNPENNYMMKVCEFIVDKRNLIFLIFALAIIFSCFSRGWVNVENDLTSYLPSGSQTKQGLEVMESEFITLGTARIAVANISFDQAQALYERASAVPGVSSVGFDNTENHYNNATALFDVTFSYDERDDRCLEPLSEVEAVFEGLDVYVSTELGEALSQLIAKEMSVIIILVAIVVVSVLLFTSQTYAEIPVLLITFISAAIINMGTNFLLGTISFVSNSVTIVLQLALSVDYAIIFCNRYKEEHENLPIREAVVVSLSKSIPEIFASSLTTIGGLVALLFMQFKIGPDMGINLIKAVFLSILSVFFLMPGLLMLFGNLIDKTHHKNFVPKITPIGRFDYKTRKLIPPLFAVVIVAALALSGRCPYVYGYDTIKTPVVNDSQEAAQLISDNFGTSNMVALIVPSGDYGAEKALLNDLSGREEVTETVGLSNTEALGGYMLTDSLTPRQFAELTDLDNEAAEVLYAAYAADQSAYGKIVGGIASYKVPLMEMFIFLHQAIDEGYLNLSADVAGEINDAYYQIDNAKRQLQGENYTRMLLYLDLPTTGDEVFSFIDTISALSREYYPNGNTYVVGDSTSRYEFYTSFQRDNVIVSVISILIVLVVLLFTFRSVGMPILLIVVIQGAIWINFSIPTIMHSDIFFMSYLIVSSIQMGANIDYAIVISNRYMELRGKMSHKRAIIETLNLSFPTIITSGTMMVLAGTFIGQMSSEATIVGIGQSLARGTIISLILVMFVLPQILLIGGGIIEKTSFSVSRPLLRRSTTEGRILVDGRVRGTISGSFTGVVHGVIEGDADLTIISGKVEEEGEKKDE